MSHIAVLFTVVLAMVAMMASSAFAVGALGCAGLPYCDPHIPVDAKEQIFAHNPNC